MTSPHARSTSVVIEAEGSDDVSAVRALLGAAFGETSVGVLVDLIRASPQYVPELALVAKVGRDVVGFVMISHAEVVQESGIRHEVLTLSPLAVATDHQGRGVGSALVRVALSAANATGAGLVTLEGSPGYYCRLGFRFAPDLGITIDLPQWAPPEAAQVYLLDAYDQRVRGRVQYPPAFSVVT